MGCISEQVANPTRLLIFSYCEGETTSSEESAERLTEVPDDIGGDRSREIHLRSWCFAAHRGKVIKGLRDLPFSLGNRMLQT